MPYNKISTDILLKFRYSFFFWSVQDLPVTIEKLHRPRYEHHSHPMPWLDTKKHAPASRVLGHVSVPRKEAPIYETLGPAAEPWQNYGIESDACYVVDFVVD